MSFNNDNYEPVKARKTRFYADHPDGRIIPELKNTDLDEKAVFKTAVFFNKEEQEKNLPRGVGWALELRDKELKRSNQGKEYESVNYTSWTENCEESSVGRALDNAGYASNGKCSKEEIEKAQRHAAVLEKKSQLNTPQNGSPSPTNKPSPSSSSALKCDVCGTELKPTKKGDAYNCPNWKDSSAGKHSYVKLEDVESFKSWQKSPANSSGAMSESDIPF